MHKDKQKTPPVSGLLKGLNSRQMEAVLAPVGPILVNAGAGSGKTRVLAHRIAHLIASGAHSESILALTFTNKAAQEMRERIRQLLTTGNRRPATDQLAASGQKQKAGPSPWIGTFHSLSAYILRKEYKAAELHPRFTIIDENSSRKLLKNVIADLKLDPQQLQPNHIQSSIAQFQNELLSPDDFIAQNRHPFAQKLYAVWIEYEKQMRSMQAIDFNYLLSDLIKLFSKHKSIAKKYNERWQHIHIDEYQDTNYPQYVIAKYLAQRIGSADVNPISFFAVGDVDQAIYSWRGADFRNMLKFKIDFPEATIITLEENYRSTPLILDAANAVIEQNVDRIPKKLVAAKSGGREIELLPAEDEKEEAWLVIQKAEELLANDIPPQEIAVMYRTNAQSRAFEDAFLARGIPYRVAGTGFYQRKEVQDILSYARFATNENDTVSLKRIINTPGRGIGKVLYKKYTFARKNFSVGISFSEKEKKLITSFERIVEKIRQKVETWKPHSVLEYIAKKSGIEAALNTSDDLQKERWLNVKELIAISKKFGDERPPYGMIRFLEEIALVSQADSARKDKKAVQLLTVHAAKGLEFKIVFIVGLEEGLFPFKSFDDPYGETKKQEEERRLFYVALTRAQDRLFLSFAKSRALFGEKTANDPSSFLKDIPLHLIKE